MSRVLALNLSSDLSFDAWKNVQKRWSISFWIYQVILEVERIGNGDLKGLVKAWGVLKGLVRALGVTEGLDLFDSKGFL